MRRRAPKGNFDKYRHPRKYWKVWWAPHPPPVRFQGFPTALPSLSTSGAHQYLEHLLHKEVVPHPVTPNNNEVPVLELEMLHHTADAETERQSGGKARQHDLKTKQLR